MRAYPSFGLEREPRAIIQTDENHIRERFHTSNALMPPSSGRPNRHIDQEWAGAFWLGDERSNALKS